MFWANLYSIFQNLPLILSDTTDPKDISFTRVTCALCIIFLIITASYVLIFVPQYFEKVSPFLTQSLNSVLLLIGGNIVKRGIDAFGSRYPVQPTVPMQHQQQQK